jgi:signal transduction histidine kinase
MPPELGPWYRAGMRATQRLSSRFHRLDPVVADGMLAALVTAISLPQLWVASPSVDEARLHFRSPNALAVLLLLCETVPLTWRRVAPGHVVAVVATASIVNLALGFKPTEADLALLVGIYTVAAHSGLRAAVRAGLIFAVALTVYGVIASQRIGVTAQDWLVNYVVFGGAWFLGNSQRQRRRYTAELEVLNARLAADQEERARWAVAEERDRIARELHDVVAHSVSVMTVQAGAARRLVGSDPRQAGEAMASIERTGRQALAELRRLLGILRREDDAAALAPQPSLEHVELLVAGARDAGLQVELQVDGEPRPLPTGVDLSAFRIVQEALTNCVKHAGPTTAHVQVRYGAHALELEVWDAGRGVPTGAPGAARGDGHGLIGMRERVALFGGELEVGPRPGGGFQVRARLPLEATAA